MLYSIRRVEQLVGGFPYTFVLRESETPLSGTLRPVTNQAFLIDHDARLGLKYEIVFPNPP